MRWFCFFLFLLSAAAHATAPLEPLTLYTERKPFLIEPLLKQYTAETGQTVQVLSDQASVLIERLKAEGRYSQADLLLTVDAGSLWLAQQAKLLAPIASPTLNAAIPANFRDPGGAWYALSLRARTIIINPTKIDAKLVQTYADLAKPALKGKLCMRSSKKVYNQSLTAMLIARAGEPAVEAMVRGWVSNFAAPPFADDTLLVQAVAAGQCPVAVVNTYYLGRMLKEQPNLPVRLIWADQAGAGVHVNISGAGVLAASNQKAAAQKLLEWLAGVEAQKMFAGLNMEYPANARAGTDPVVMQWGSFKQDRQALVNAGKMQAQAVRLMDRAGWK
jgi:iron(III) transport system substrate-binding protein